MFDINNSKDKLNLLVSDYERLKLNPLDISLALKACSDAWHLCDWVFDETYKGKIELRTFRITLYSECPEMRILHDLANTDKHKTLDSSKAKIQSTNVHTGDFSSEDFSKEDYDVSRLEVYCADDTKIEVDDLIKIAIDYWTKRLSSS